MFKINEKYKPKGDQEQAVKKLVDGIKKNKKYQTLLGITGSGKTFTMAKIIEEIQMPALVLSHNKTLSAQLYREFKDFFPNNAVEYFVSYYDYYQPEAYVPSKDLYIEKDASINEEIERFRISATASLIDRKDVIIVATVSSIYGLGSPEDYRDLTIFIKTGMQIDRKEFIEKLIEVQYERNQVLTQGSFRINGDIIDIHPSYSRYYLRIETFDDNIEKIKKIDAITNQLIEILERTLIYPAKHFVTKKEKMKNIITQIKEELNERVKYFKSQKKEIEAQRLISRVNHDIEMLEQIGYCKGIENYSRFLSGRKPGERPYTLIDYFPKDFICFVDESHITLPQVRAMYEGDRYRKQNLVDYGFRLPSALDNRPLKFDEFINIIPSFVFVSATPGDYELTVSSQVVEQIIRPTGLVDPEVMVRPSENQIDDILNEIQKRIKRNERVLVTTLTKKMAEELTKYLEENGVKARYIHSEVETVERVEILRDLRKGVFDVLAGINLLREGLDLPEVSLVIILDADKVGFLRSTRSLIQIIGRAARNENGTVIMYADRISDSMKEAIEITNKRREKQIEYNRINNIIPQTIKKDVSDIIERKIKKEEKDTLYLEKNYELDIREERIKYLKKLEEIMYEYSKNLMFEEAAKIRDEIYRIKREYENN